MGGECSRAVLEVGNPEREIAELWDGAPVRSFKIVVLQQRDDDSVLDSPHPPRQLV
jgi:hypothetical protein